MTEDDQDKSAGSLALTFAQIERLVCVENPAQSAAVIREQHLQRMRKERHARSVMITRAFEEGMNAYVWDGLPRTANPYHANGRAAKERRRWQDWDRGHTIARKEAQFQRLGL